VRNDGSQPMTLNGYAGTTRFEYVRSEESWWAIASTIAHRMGVGKAGWIGTWTVWLVILLVVAAITLAAWSLVRRPVSP
jgi:hypothetical protein